MHALRFSESWENYPELADSDLILKFESEFKIEVPTEFRQFLLETVNGGGPKEEYGLPVIDNDWIDLRYASGIRSGDYDLRQFFRELSGSIYPDVCFPVIWDSLGNSIYIAHTGKHQGKVFFYDHEQFDKIEKDPYLFPIANSFWELLDSAKLDSELELLLGGQ